MRFQTFTEFYLEMFKEQEDYNNVVHNRDDGKYQHCRIKHRINDTQNGDYKWHKGSKIFKDHNSTEKPRKCIPYIPKKKVGDQSHLNKG